MSKSIPAKKIKISGQPSFQLKTKQVEAYITEQAGHLAPAKFYLGKRWVSPFSVSPWVEEKIDHKLPTMLKVLRGDFFCMPFGGNEAAFRGEKHPAHGETANGKWKLEKSCSEYVHLSMQTKIRKGKVDKFVKLVPGHTALYVQHVISGMKGPMNVGHHPIIDIPEGTTGRLSVSPIRFGAVTPIKGEDSAQGGYISLKTGGQFKSLNKVPQVDGGWADLSVYPDPKRNGFEDIVQLVGDPKRSFGWTAMVIPEKNYVWFALKDPRVLPSTLLWMSNGGRHYAPWNGRHRRKIGLEEIVSYFHYGLDASAKPNPVSKAGVPTCLNLNPQKPAVVNYIMAMAEVPRGFDIVKDIKPTADKKSVKLTSKSGKSVVVKLDVSFLYAKPLA